MKNALKNHKILVAGIGGALLALCLVIGAFVVGPLVASAATNPTATPSTTTKAKAKKTDYCAEYEQALAKQLGVSVQTLTNDHDSALKATINQEVKDKKITQDRANKLIDEINKHPQFDNGCAILHKNHTDVGKAVFLKYRTNIENQVAQGLHLTSAQLVSQLQSGKTLAQIAQAQHVSATDLHTLINNTINATLKQAVSDKTITQQRADAITKFLSKHADYENSIVNKQFVNAKTSTKTSK
jgi:hypothetical protein